MRLLDSLLHNLVADVPDLPRVEERGGRPAIPLSEALYCAILKVYSGISGLRACGVYENVSDRDLLESVPSYNVASRALNRPAATALLYRILQLRARPSWDWMMAAPSLPIAPGSSRPPSEDGGRRSTARCSRRRGSGYTPSSGPRPMS